MLIDYLNVKVLMSNFDELDGFFNQLVKLLAPWLLSDNRRGDSITLDLAHVDTSFHEDVTSNSKGRRPWGADNLKIFNKKIKEK